MKKNNKIKYYMALILPAFLMMFVFCKPSSQEKSAHGAHWDYANTNWSSISEDYATDLKKWVPYQVAGIL